MQTANTLLICFLPTLIKMATATAVFIFLTFAKCILCAPDLGMWNAMLSPVRIILILFTYSVSHTAAIFLGS